MQAPKVAVLTDHGAGFAVIMEASVIPGQPVKQVWPAMQFDYAAWH
jgi:hypothetical protein